MASTTQSTVVAVFSGDAAARAAANDLKSAGIGDNDIYISSETEAAAQTGYAETGSSHHHEGGFKGWWHRLFSGDDEYTDRDYYQTAVGSGNVLLSVDTEEENTDEVVDILNRYSPIDIQEQAGSATANQGASNTGYSDAQAVAGQTNQSGSVPVVQEDLRVGKRSVVRGGVRVYTRVIEEPVEESVRLRDEKVRVQRQPVNRPANENDLRAGEEQVIEVKEYAEEPVVSKEARVVEEVRVGKDATERTETVRDKVRRTEVEVEDLEKKGPQSAAPDDLSERRKSATNKQ